MRREQFTVEFSDVSWVGTGADPTKPTLTITIDGDAETLAERLAAGDGLRDAGEIDIGFRLQGTPEQAAADGVVSVTDRLTGDYVLELNANADAMLSFIHAARRFGKQTDENGQYRVRIRAGEDEIATYEKRTLLVYSEDGELLRQHSLIPSGVEI